MYALNDLQIHYSKLLIKKSQFLSFVKKVVNKQQVEDFVEELTFAYPDARHLCYAWKIGTNNFEAGFDDGGEPHQTAGYPIYKLIEQKQLTNLCVVVVRYFGGIKLGAGGLIRAYSKAANQVLIDGYFHELINVYEITIEFSIQFIKEVDNFCIKNDLQILNKAFQENQVFYTLISQTDYLNFNSLNIKNFKIIEKLE